MRLESGHLPLFIYVFAQIATKIVALSFSNQFKAKLATLQQAAVLIFTKTTSD